ncbi:hypothetical protein BDV93DRAFT_561987 [Ceratobasidium sp. AG-I]|nr:hypothetical protein BDV93DRAFT_561987 [Ceratobasidium sp. AG-I]
MPAGAVLLLFASWLVFVNGQALFLRLANVDSTSASQCANLKVVYGGGVPPYQLWSWSKSKNEIVLRQQSAVSGAIAWRMQYKPSGLYPGLLLKDAAQETVEITQRTIEISVNADCFGTSTLEARAAKPTQQSILQDCANGGPADCSFMPLGRVGIYPQLALIGNPFANCASNKPVTQTLEGSVTITDNWSVEISGSFTTHSNELSAQTTVGCSHATTLTQSISYVISPGMQSALVGIARFNGTSGNMVMGYRNGTILKVPRIVYFRNTGETPIFQRLDVPCSQPWPTWNPTPELVVPNDTAGVHLV